MKKIVFFFLLVQLSGYSLFPAEKAETGSASVLDLTLYSVDFRSVYLKFAGYVKTRQYTTVSFRETDKSCFLEVDISPDELPEIENFINTLGYVAKRNLTTKDIRKNIGEKNLDLEYQEKLKAEYEKMLERIDAVQSDRHYEHWQKIRDIDQEIYKIKKSIKNLEEAGTVIRIKLEISDEAFSPKYSRKVNFINMPGAEYSQLFIQNPKKGISYETYRGWALKYLFTKGKSYVTVGSMKKQESEELSDPSGYDEILNFAFGQDYYSRFFGRGANRYLNIYIGYRFGISYLFSPSGSRSFSFVSPGLGLEILKTKYVLLDLNTDYYIPIAGENVSLRGLKANFSANVLF